MSDEQTGEALTDKAQAAIDAGNMDDALAIFQQAVHEGHTSYRVYHNIAKIYLHRNQYEPALKYLLLAQPLHPDGGLLNSNIGKCLLKLGRYDEAYEHLSMAADKTDDPGIRVCLADVLVARSQFQESADLLMQIIPEQLEAVIEVVKKFKFSRHYHLSEQLCLKILEYGERASVLNELGLIYQKQARLEESLEIMKRAVEIQPENAHILSNLGNSYAVLGEMDKALDLMARAVEYKQDDAFVHANFLYNLHCLPSMEPQTMFEAHKLWGQAHAPIERARTRHDNEPAADRPLRVGFVSPDFRMHSVSYFFETLLDHRDPEAMQVICYANFRNPDHVTERIIAKADQFTYITDMDRDRFDRQVVSDQIDILIDLAGHTGESRLADFCRKPAPILATWLGYPDTSGMAAMDYRITDPIADPPETACYYTEQLAYLPDGFLCYRPPEWAPPVAESPARANGYITFGSFNNQRKINPLCIGLWSQCLLAVPDSRMLLKVRSAADTVIRDKYWSDFEKCGVDRDRIEIIGPQDSLAHLNAYGQIDIALDTFPYHGTTTTFEALLMGVPVITLVGNHHATRVGGDILKRMGMDLCVTRMPAEFVGRAAALAEQEQARDDIRQSMRQRMAQSTLCNGPHFTRQFQTLLRQMWYRWCASQGVKTPPRETSLFVDAAEQAPRETATASAEPSDQGAGVSLPSARELLNPAGQTSAEQGPTPEQSPAVTVELPARLTEILDAHQPPPLDPDAPAVTLAVLTYNRPEGLVQALQAAIAQDYPNLKIVIHDNASDEPTPTLCRAFADADPRVEYIQYPENRGMATNFCHAAEIADTPLFMWLCDDDWMDPNYISVCARELQHDPSLVTAAGRTRHIKDGEFFRDSAENDILLTDPADRVLAHLSSSCECNGLYGVHRIEALRQALHPFTVKAPDLMFLTEMAWLGGMRITDETRMHKDYKWSIEWAANGSEAFDTPFHRNNHYPGLAMILFGHIMEYAPTADLPLPERLELACSAVFTYLDSKNSALDGPLREELAKDHNHADPWVISQALQMRRYVVAGWLDTPANALRTRWAGPVGRMHKLLVDAGLCWDPAGPDDADLDRQIDDRLGESTGPALGGVLAADLLGGLCRRELPPTVAWMPYWVAKDLLGRLYAAPPFFQNDADAESFYDHLVRWTRTLRDLVRRDQQSLIYPPAVVNAINAFLEQGMVIGGYFNDRPRRDLWQPRGQLIEGILQAKNQPLDHHFCDRRNRKRIRLGILKNHWGHQTETYTTLPYFTDLDRSRFEIILYHHQWQDDDLEHYCESYADRRVQLTGSISEQVNRIRRDDLDALLIGTNVTAVNHPVTLLAAHRLARVQMANFSSPVTTGLRNIDAYISGTLSQSEDAQQDYTEKLVMLDGPGFCFDFSKVPTSSGRGISRRDLSLPDDAVIFASGAVVNKMTPELWACWADILRDVPDAAIVVYPYAPSWYSQFPKRVFSEQFCRSFTQAGIGMDRIRIVDALPSREAVKALLANVDVYLDSSPYTGSNSNMDPLEVAVPPVITEGRQMTSRQGAAILRDLGLDELVASDLADYARIAIDLGRNADRRAEFADRIAQALKANPRCTDSARYSEAFGQAVEDLLDDYQQQDNRPIPLSVKPAVA